MSDCQNSPKQPDDIYDKSPLLNLSYDITRQARKRGTESLLALDREHGCSLGNPPRWPLCLLAPYETAIWLCEELIDRSLSILENGLVSLSLTAIST